MPGPPAGCGGGATDTLRFLTARPFAHRGLHDRASGVVENSMEAFRLAVRGGYGIELDVQLTGDGDVIVFHDAELARLTGSAGRVDSLPVASLARLRLTGCGEALQPLGDVLRAIREEASLKGASVPVLVEVKTSRAAARRVSAATARAVLEDPGPIAVMSFNPGVGGWFAAHAPHIVRGLVVSDEKRRAKPFFRLRRAVEHRMSVWRARPHFLAYDIRSLPSPLSRRFRGRGRPVLCWTVRTDRERERGGRDADQIIFEGTA